LCNIYHASACKTFCLGDNNVDISVAPQCHKLRGIDVTLPVTCVKNVGKLQQTVVYVDVHVDINSFVYKPLLIAGMFSEISR